MATCQTVKTQERQRLTISCLHASYVLAISSHNAMNHWTVWLTKPFVRLRRRDFITRKPCYRKETARCRSFRFLQGVSVAASPVLATIGMSVRLSVRLSVTRWHWVKTTQARITKSSPTDSPRTLVFGIKNSSRKSTGVTPSEGVKWEWGRKNSQFSANNSPYLRNGAR